jgi:DNA-binding response OmpR family regulator
MDLILVIDGEFPSRRLVRDHLEQADYRVLTASDAQTGLNMLRCEAPDLLIVDLNLPHHDGWNLTRTIRLDSELATLPILGMTPQARVAHTIDETGVNDFVTKPFNPRELVARVRSLLHRSKGLSSLPTRISRGDLVLDVGGQKLTVREEPVELTPTEFALLCMFMEKPGHIFTRRELLEKTLGHSDEGAGRTLDTHIRNLRQKIESDPHRPIYIQTIHRVGYRFSWLGGEMS